jgi:four helix bundle protein
MDEDLVQKKSFEFALSMIRLYRKLQARQEVILSSQLLRSGTRIGVKVEEAAAEQEHRFGKHSADSWLAATKEARETRYWLKLLQASRLADVDVTSELDQLTELMNLLNQMMQ